jgi:hypothetical protein
MLETDSLSPVEARGLRRRRAVAQWTLGIFYVAAFGSMIALGYEGSLEWFVACMPVAFACLLLHVWGMRCPRCRNSAETAGPVHDLWGLAGPGRRGRRGR